MPQIGTYIALAASTIFYIAITWVVVDKLGLTGTQATIAQVVLVALGLSAAAVFVWWRHKKAKEKGEAGELPAEQDDLGPLFRDAEQRLAASKLGREGRIGMLPAVLVLGDSGSAKTSVIINSGSEAELLGGHVYQDGYVVPTRSLNLWFARDTVVVEAGGALTTHAGKGGELLKRLKPAQLRQVFGRGRQAPRAAVVCVDAEGFLQPGSQETMTQLARRLNARLGEVCRALGIQLPVYVLFTRCDRIPFFMDFVANLSDEEARQVVGATVPLALDQRIGTYAEDETRRLTAAFHDLFLGLADHRPVLLKREHHAERLPGVYEFPREFRKLRSSLVQFLVDLCRPSQLQTSPYLRGFYFSGVRPVEVREVVKTSKAAAPAGLSAGEATGVFSMGGGAAAGQQASVQVRRVPQWVFVHRLFNEVILADQMAFRASSMSVGTNMGRRMVFGAAAALALIIATLFTVSFFKNRALQSEVSEAVARIAAAGSPGQDLAALDTLQRLEALRANVEKLTVWSREGAPWSMRWGLYTGDSLLPVARRLYFDRFKQVLFGATQEGLAAWCRKLPATPGPEDDYGYTYDTLKAYLITTSHPDKSTKMFLSPLLLKRWAGDRQVDAERQKLAQAQFDFYAEELKHGNMFSSENDSAAIERARRYLNQFAGAERVYQFMLAEAGRKHPAVNFNKQFPGSAQVIINNRDIPGAFTKAGYAFMMDAIKNWEKFFEGEEWVLGPRASAAVDRAKIEPELLARYRTDFLGNWREYLRSSTIVRYASVQDAAQKLGLMSNNASFLLALLCVASENTAAAALEELKAPFQPVQFVTPPGCSSQYIGQSNQQYMNGLIGLQTALEGAGRATDPNDPAVASTLQFASQAKLAARQLAQGFRIDKEGKVEQMTQKLLEDPITYVEGLLGRLGPAQVNAGARQMCADFAPLMKKYPFDPNSTVDATIADINAVFKPGTGSFWVFYESTLKQHLLRQGGRFAPNPASSGIRITPQFLGFFNRAAAFSDALYANGNQQEPSFVYTLRTLPMDVIASLTLSIDGAQLKSTGKGGAQASFTWPGRGQQQARLSATPGGRETDWLQFTGLWGAFRLFEDADRWQRAGNGFTFEVTQRSGQSGQAVTVDGKPVTVRFALEMGTTEPIFQKGYLSGLRCVSQAAQ